MNGPPRGGPLYHLCSPCGETPDFELHVEYVRKLAERVLLSCIEKEQPGLDDTTHLLTRYESHTPSAIGVPSNDQFVTVPHARYLQLESHPMKRDEWCLVAARRSGRRKVAEHEHITFLALAAQTNRYACFHVEILPTLRYQRKLQTGRACYDTYHMALDILAFGDPTTDCFIRLKDARVNCDINDTNCMLSLRFGDKVPFEFAVEVPAVGNAANAAVACARLGLSSAFRGSVGADKNGETIIRAFKEHGVDTQYIETEPGKVTNYHYVLWFLSERTILIKHENFTRSLPALPEPPKWVYLSSLGEGTEKYQHDIARYAKESNAKLLFQPGTFQIKLGKDTLKDVYAVTDLFFCNKEEAQIILGVTEVDVKQLLTGIRALGPKVAVVTDGRGGSYLMSESGAWHSPMYPDPAPPVERTGAGDATASTTMAYMIKGLPPGEALQRGLINSAYVVQEIGAQKGLLTEEKIAELYDTRPADFQLTAI
jgi:sugar/nucleoside kinase (ribokinase family)